jgi:hypothetical protein
MTKKEIKNIYIYMPRKCPPGVICIENMSFVFLFIIIALAIIVYFQLKQHTAPLSQPNIIVENRLPPRKRINRSVLLNPYTPPLRNTMFFSSNWGVPINVPTRSFNTSYRQVGILTRVNGVETILPLMGRPLHINRNKWQYYTMSDKNNSVKLPVSRNGKSCTNEYGCDNLYNGDTIYAEGYNDAFKVTMYDNEIPRYLPFF